MLNKTSGRKIIENVYGTEADDDDEDFPYYEVKLDIRWGCDDAAKADKLVAELEAVCDKYYDEAFAGSEAMGSIDKYDQRNDKRLSSKKINF
jgi:zona occludens toxin (predicted ATPase)